MMTHLKVVLVGAALWGMPVAAVPVALASAAQAVPAVSAR